MGCFELSLGCHKSVSVINTKDNDHDNHWEAVLVPFGILNTETKQLSIYLGESAETSDFIADCLTAWWQENRANYMHIKELVIALDGGPANPSNRTQFIKRLVEFSRISGLNPIVHRVETVYEKGVKLSKLELKPFLPFWQRSETLPKWDVTIVPI